MADNDTDEEDEDIVTGMLNDMCVYKLHLFTSLPSIVYRDKHNKVK